MFYLLQVGYLSSTGVSFFLLRRARKRQVEITAPCDGDVPFENQTFCIFSVKLISLLKVALVMNIVTNLLSIVMMNLSDKTVQRIYSLEFSEDLDSGVLFKNVFPIVNMTLLQCMILLQAFEWRAMESLICFQKGKTIEEILYDCTAHGAGHTEQQANRELYSRLKISRIFSCLYSRGERFKHSIITNSASELSVDQK